MSQVNFRIIEGGVDFDYNQFRDDYLNSDYTALDLRKKHHISLKRYKELQERVVNETGFRRRAGLTLFHNPLLYIRKTNSGRYRIDKHFPDRKVYCGTYEDLDCALKIRDVLIGCDWDKDKIIELQDKYGVGSVV